MAGEDLIQGAIEVLLKRSDGADFPDAVWVAAEIRRISDLFPDTGLTCGSIDTARMLPAWFLPRMMDDVGCFGLLLTTGHVLGINRIIKLTRDAQGDLWIDVDMLTSDPHGRFAGRFAVIAPTSRSAASVRVSEIVAAFELAET